MRGQRGQALMELVLVLPLFLGFLLGGALLARLTLIRLELIHLSRETALGLSRSQTESPDPAALARTLAARSEVLEPLSLTAETTSALGTNWTLPEGVPMPDFAKSMTGSLLEGTAGTKLTLRYRFPAPRYARAAFPDGFPFEESVVFKGDPWKDPKGRMKRMFSLSRNVYKLFKKEE